MEKHLGICLQGSAKGKIASVRSTDSLLCYHVCHLAIRTHQKIGEKVCFWTMLYALANKKSES